MSITIRFEIEGSEEAVRSISQLSTHGVASAQVRAINRLGFAARDSWKERSRTLFDRPTPLTERAFLVRKAALESPIADVFLRDEADGTPPSVFLSPHIAEIADGTRPLKRFERLLIARGRMRSGHIVVPGQFAKLDRFGNISRGQLNKILSALDAQFDARSNQSARSKARKRRSGERVIFALPYEKNGLRPGVYERDRLGIARPVLAFVRPGTYRARVSAGEFVSEVIAQHGPRMLSEELHREIDRSIRAR